MLSRSSVTKLRSQPNSFAFVLLLANQSLLQPLKVRNRRKTILPAGDWHAELLGESLCLPPPDSFCFYSWEPRKVENRVGKVNEIKVVNRKEEVEDEIVLIHHTSTTNLHLKQKGNHFTLVQASLLMTLLRCQLLRQTTTVNVRCLVPCPSLILSQQK